MLFNVPGLLRKGKKRDDNLLKKDVIKSCLISYIDPYYEIPLTIVVYM